MASFMEAYAIAGASGAIDGGTPVYAGANADALNAAQGQNNIAAAENFAQCFIGGPGAYSDTGLGVGGAIPCGVGVAASTLLTMGASDALQEFIAAVRVGKSLIKGAPSESACGTCGGASKKLGDLTPDEVRQIQRVVDDLQGQIDAELGPGVGDAELSVVGSAARGERRGVGTDLPIGHDPPGAPGTTRSDIDYVAPRSLEDFFQSGFATPDEQLPQRSLPGFHDFQGTPFFGDPRPGPSILFRPGQDPVYRVVPP
jgi:hypothetical protein